jgi:hypothetical protein
MHISLSQTILRGPHIEADYLIHWAHTFGGMNIREAERIASAFTVYGELTTIGNLLPFAQAAKETGWFTSDRWTKSYNPAGLGATNDGAWGATFHNPAEGILAQYAHLIAYAVDPNKMNVVQRTLMLLDPRYEAVKRQGWLGIAPTWVALNGKWASPGRDYGESIIKRANELVKGASGVFL